MHIKERKNVLVLLSGGIDSTACISYYSSLNYFVSALHINYGQLSAVNENCAAKKIADYYKIDLHYLALRANPTLSGFIPGRNSLLLDLALMHFPYSTGIISIGIHSGTQYSDCSTIYKNKMQEIFDLYTGGLIRIDAPFVNWNKGDIFEFCKRNNTPLQLTYSCELGKKQPCGECLSCTDLENLCI